MGGATSAPRNSLPVGCTGGRPPLLGGGRRAPAPLSADARRRGPKASALPTPIPILNPPDSEPILNSPDCFVFFRQQNEQSFFLGCRYSAGTYIIFSSRNLVQIPLNESSVGASCVELWRSRWSIRISVPMLYITLFFSLFFHLFLNRTKKTHQIRIVQSLGVSPTFSTRRALSKPVFNIDFCGMSVEL